MLNKKYLPFLCGFAIGAAILFLMWLTTFSASFQSCQQTEQNRETQDEPQNTEEEPPPGLGQLSMKFIVCEGSFLDKNETLMTAIATVIIAIFTATLYRATESIHLLTRQQYLAAYRPLLKIRYVRLTGGTAKENVSAQFTVVNASTSRAVVIGHGAKFEWFKEPLPHPLLFNMAQFIEETDFPAGAEQACHVQGDFTLPSFDHVFRKDEGLYLYGVIVYTDDLGAQRTTAFCRRYESGSHRFVAVEDPDYEYTD